MYIYFRNDFQKKNFVKSNYFLCTIQQKIRESKGKTECFQLVKSISWVNVSVLQWSTIFKKSPGKNQQGKNFVKLIFLIFFLQVGDYSVSLKAPGRNKHFRVHVEGTLFCIGQRKFPTLQQLVEHYQRAPIYTSQKGEKLFLIRPLPK